MNITRMGHYYNPGNGSCTWATVIKVVTPGAITSVVNLKVIDGDGDESRHLNVPENTGPRDDDTAASFHLSTTCPWGR